MALAIYPSPLRQFRWCGVALLLVSLLGLPLLSGLQATRAAQNFTYAEANPTYANVGLVKPLTLAPANARVTLKLREASIRDILNILARQGGFNVVIDQSLKAEDTLTVDVVDVSINKALEYILTMGNLSYTQDGKTLLIATREANNTRQLSRRIFKALPVKYKDAQMIAMQLNSTLFLQGNIGNTQQAIASADPMSNTLLVIGTENDLSLVRDALAQLDVPRNMRRYIIQHNDPTYVATMLMSMFFMPIGGAAGGQAGGLAGGAQAGGIAGGQAGGQVGGAQAGGAAGGQAGGLAGGAQAGGIAGGQAGGLAGGQAGGAAGGQAGGMGVGGFTVGGVTFIPEPISQTLTVIATPQQLELIDSVIDEIDVRRPQVHIEMALVELSRGNTKVHQPSIGSFQIGEWNFGTLLGGNTNAITIGGTPGSFVLPTVSLINQLQENRGRILANPNIVALDGTESTIEITDQVATFNFTVTVGVGGQPTIVPNASTQDVGITLAITPQVSNDGSVTLKLSPEVTQLIDIVEGGDATTGIQQVPLIATRRLDVAAVRVKDGETLVLGGLLQETRLESLNKVPFLADLPIIGAMFRATNTGGNTTQRTELVVMVTPHILKEGGVTYFSHPDAANTFQRSQYAPNNGKVQPLPLPTGVATPLTLPAAYKGRAKQGKPPVVMPTQAQPQAATNTSTLAPPLLRPLPTPSSLQPITLPAPMGDRVK
jgi:type II secretory pathway component GspD/PulD (secretin)